jgi:predicted NUDIX family NTP pyrophosphohydrolase
VEVDRAAWFDLACARSKIHEGQVATLDDLHQKLG